MFSVIFDMDGTLLDSQRVISNAWFYALDLQNLQKDYVFAASCMGMNETGWRNKLKERYPDIDISRFVKDLKQHTKEHYVVEFKKGAKELLDFLKENDIKVALASGSPKDLILENLTCVNALCYFDAIIGSEDVKRGKPEPDVFLLAAEKIGAENEDCFVFEDSANGIIAAHKAGMKPIGVTDLFPFDKETKKLMFKELKSLDQAIDIFKKYL